MFCNQVMDSEYCVPFDYMKKGERLKIDEVSGLKKNSSEKIFWEKKLQLVFDLDNTLIHSKKYEELIRVEKFSENQIGSLQEDMSKGSIFKLTCGY